jgi:quercetin dioxygenase-like cupin family protein
MNRTITLAALLSVGGLFLASQARAEDKGKTAPAVMMTPEEVKWVDVPNAPGVQSATVEGDAAKGQHHFFLKFAPGFTVGVHHHTADHFGTVVKGTMVLTVNGKESKLAPGAYFSFNHKQPHATRCEAGSECVLFIDSRGAWDAVMPDAKAKKM